MIDTQKSELDRKRLVCQLRELIQSLDNRVPHLEREGEVWIAREAAALRDTALERLAQLQHESLQ